MDLTIREGGLDHPAVVSLLEHHLVDFAQHSPAESMHALDISGLQADDVMFWSVWSGADLVGCGALKRLGPTHGEIKSMRVVDRHQGSGAGTALLSHVVDWARDRRFARLSLETGSPDAFAPARRLYERHGFVECEPFGDYRADPWSTFMTLDLSSTGR